MVREEALVLALVPAMAELAQGLVLAALVPVVQEQVALEWEPASGRRAVDLRFASCCPPASKSGRSPDSSSELAALAMQCCCQQ
jgi:hypothetical protein